MGLCVPAELHYNSWLRLLAPQKVTSGDAAVPSVRQCDGQIVAVISPCNTIQNDSDVFCEEIVVTLTFR